MSHMNDRISRLNALKRIKNCVEEFWSRASHELLTTDIDELDKMIGEEESHPLSRLVHKELFDQVVEERDQLRSKVKRSSDVMGCCVLCLGRNHEDDCLMKGVEHGEGQEEANDCQGETRQDEARVLHLGDHQEREVRAVHLSQEGSS